MSTDEQPHVRIAYRSAANLRGERHRLQRRRNAIEFADHRDVARAALLEERIARLDTEINAADAREAQGGV